MQDTLDNDSTFTPNKSQSPDDSISTLRVYHSKDCYIDIVLSQFDTSDYYFIKDKQSFLRIREIFTDQSSDYIGKLSEDDYISFLREKIYDDFNFEFDKSFPELKIPSFDRESINDVSTASDFSYNSILDESMVDLTREGNELDFAINITPKAEGNELDFAAIITPENQSFIDSMFEITSKNKFDKKNDAIVINNKKTERKKENRRQRKLLERIEKEENEKEEEKLAKMYAEAMIFKDSVKKQYLEELAHKFKMSQEDIGETYQIKDLLKSIDGYSTQFHMQLKEKKYKECYSLLELFTKMLNMFKNWRYV